MNTPDDPARVAGPGELWTDRPLVDEDEEYEEAFDASEAQAYFASQPWPRSYAEIHGVQACSCGFADVPAELPCEIHGGGK